jgi:hypothetical protein
MSVLTNFGDFDQISSYFYHIFRIWTRLILLNYDEFF